MSVSQDDLEVIPGNGKFEVLDSFRYLGDPIRQSGSCFEVTIDRVRVAWKNFHRLLPVLTNSSISLKVRGHPYNICI